MELERPVKGLLQDVGSPDALAHDLDMAKVRVPATLADLAFFWFV